MSTWGAGGDSNWGSSSWSAPAPVQQHGQQGWGQGPQDQWSAGGQKGAAAWAPQSGFASSGSATIDPTEEFVGVLKILLDKGIGFIQCDEIKKRCGRDAFVPPNKVQGLQGFST